MQYILVFFQHLIIDYDFSDVKPDYFQKVPSLGIVMNNVNNSLLIHFKEAKISSEQAIWESMDRVIDTKVTVLYPPTMCFLLYQAISICILRTYITSILPNVLDIVMQYIVTSIPTR